MMDFLPTYIVDANIVIDLYVGGLLSEFFQLPYRFAAPDVVIAEMDEPDGKTLITHGLVQEELSGEQVLLVSRLRAHYRQVSVRDLFALILAQSQDTILLTGDQHLRKVAEIEQVTVHGTLWIMSNMVGLGIVSPDRAARALKRMLARGSRLPEEECQKLIQQWET